MKIICVPKDLPALHRLDYDLSETGDLIEVHLDDRIVAKLFEVNFFQQVNTIANSNIDDFEDEKIVGEEKLMEILNSNVFEYTGFDDDLREVVHKIKGLFHQALSRKTGVFFYF